MNIKEIALPPRVFRKAKKWHSDSYACRVCGTGITEAQYKYCPNCGHKILHASFAGACGWKYEDAEKKMKEILYDEEKGELLLKSKNRWLYE